MDSNIFQPVLLWVQENPNWSGFVVFTISFLESLVGPGFFIPGVFFMSGIGALVGAGVLSMWPTLTYAVIGAVAGDYASFWIGWRYRDALRQSWFFKRYPGLLTRGYAFFRKHGGKSIVFGRFVGPVRPIIPVIAGMMHMAPKKFVFANILSALLWAPFYSSPGYFVGLSLTDFSLEIAARICAYLLLFILFIWVCHFGYTRTISMLAKKLRAFAKWQGHTLSQHPVLMPIQRTLIDKRFTHHPGQVLQANLVIVSLVLFVICAVSLCQHSGLFFLNDELFHFSRAAHILKADMLFTFMTKLGEISLLKYPLILVGLYCFFKRKWAVLIHGVVLLGTIKVVAHVLKAAFMNPRPEGILAVLEGCSFPSGHTFLATGVFGFFALVIARDLRPRFRCLPILSWLTLTALVMTSRLYLGAHWALDVLGGFFLSLSILLALNIHYRHVCKDRFPVRTCSILMLVGIVFGYGVQIANNKLLQDYAGYQLTFKEAPATFKDWQNEKIPHLLTRINVFGKEQGVFNLQVVDDEQHLRASLNAAGWMLRPKFKVSYSAQWFSGHPAPDRVPAFPLFHNDRARHMRMDRTEILVRTGLRERL